MFLMLARLSSAYNSLAPRWIDIRIIALACQVLSIHISCVLQLQAEWLIRVESLLGLLVHAALIVVPFLDHSTIIITNALINPAGSCYIITDY